MCTRGATIRQEWWPTLFSQLRARPGNTAQQLSGSARYAAVVASGNTRDARVRAPAVKCVWSEAGALGFKAFATSGSKEITARGPRVLFLGHVLLSAIRTLPRLHVHRREGFNNGRRLKGNSARDRAQPSIQTHASDFVDLSVLPSPRVEPLHSTLT